MDSRLHAFAPNGYFYMLALDHRGSFKDMLAAHGSADEATIIERKKDIITALSGAPTGVLVDIEYGLQALRASQSSLPYLLAMEKSGYEMQGDDRHTELVHSAAEITEKGGSGAKLLLYMEGDGEEGDRAQVRVAKEALADAKTHDLPLFLEIVIYGEGKKEVGSRTRAAMEHCMKEGITPAVWKVEFPGASQCRDLTACAGDTPWILLSRGVSFDAFVEEARIAMAEGARGFLVGRSLWQESLGLETGEREAFAHTMRERFNMLLSASPVVA